MKKLFVCCRAVVLSRCRFIFLLLASCFLLLPRISTAGGPISVGPDGDASKWVSPISLHPETGSCATFSNAQMRARLTTNVAYWEDITGISLNFTITTGGVTVDVDDTNYGDYYVGFDAVGTYYDDGVNDSLNPVAFDDDGAIVDAIFGSGNRFSVLGFAGPDAYTSTSLETIADGQAFFNCRCLAGNAEGACPESIVFTTDDLDFTMTHEIGHMIGLDHTQVNQSVDSSNRVETFSCDISVDGDCDDIPTMYPSSIDAADQISPSRDDEVALLSLYGLTYLTNNFCTVTGSLTDSSDNPLRCADVQATTSDQADTIAQVSGVMAIATDSNADFDTGDSGECSSGCGDFTLRGLDPSKTYTITVKPIATNWGASLGSSLGPCGPSLPSGIVEEEIASVSGCTAGSTTDLGTVRTTSSGGVSDDDDDDDDSSSSSGCALTASASPNWVGYIFFFLALLALLSPRKSAKFKN